jgi:hypothetical protein
VGKHFPSPIQVNQVEEPDLPSGGCCRGLDASIRALIQSIETHPHGFFGKKSNEHKFKEFK